MSIPDAHIPWFALYVKSRHEKRVAVSLDRKGVETFLPTYQKRHRKNQTLELPVFPGYVFCQADNHKIFLIATTPGVFSIVSHGSVPARVPESEIEPIRRMVEAGLMLTPWPYMSRGQVVYVNSGPLRGVEAIVEDGTDKTWLIASVHLLQRSVAAKIDRSYF
jgi:transcription antitermination factor NusG